MSEANAARRPGPVLIGINPGGRLGNHLYSFAWMIAIARATGGVATYPAFAAHRNLFESTAAQSVATWPGGTRLDGTTRLVLRLCHRRVLQLYHHFRITRQRRLDEAGFLVRWAPGVRRDWGFIAFDWLVDGPHAVRKLPPTFADAAGAPDYFSERVQRYVASKRRVVFDSAAIPPPPFPEEDVRPLREFFRPRTATANEARAWIAAQRAQAGAEVAIGVAVRQGDFRTWGGGSDFVAPERFAGLLRRIQERAERRRVLFVLCSDEALDPAGFAGVTAVRAPPGPLVQLCTLMSCDFILGTAASTFIHWASFLGDVPWWPVANDDAREVPPTREWRVFGVRAK